MKLVSFYFFCRVILHRVHFLGRSLSLMTPAATPDEKVKRFVSQLHLYPPWAESTVSYVAWLEAPGIQHGGIDQTAADPYKILTQQKLYG